MKSAYPVKVFRVLSEPDKHDTRSDGTYPKAYRLLQANDLSDSEWCITFNGTLMNGGQVRNMIPDKATAWADVRVNRLTDLKYIEQRYRERIATQTPLVPDTTVEADFEQRRPPLEVTDASRALARTAQVIMPSLVVP